MTQVAAVAQPTYRQKGGIRLQRGLNSNKEETVSRPECATAFKRTNYMTGKGKLNKKKDRIFHRAPEKQRTWEVRDKVSSVALRARKMEFLLAAAVGTWFFTSRPGW